MESLRYLAKSLLGRYGYRIVKSEGYQDLCQRFDAAESSLWSLRNHISSESQLQILIDDLRKSDPSGLSKLLEHSKSQIGQDLFVISRLGPSADGRFFVEFGATNGISMSNTYMLEKHFGWRGIVAEPAKVWHDALTRNRSCSIDKRCVAASSGQQVTFLEVMNTDLDFRAIPELSGIKSEIADDDWAATIRKNYSQEYEVESISLNDLLKFHQAPNRISYLSIDTEGSELSILKAFDFEKYFVDIITVEHNFNEPAQSGLHSLLTSKGFQRVHENISQWDGWYVHG